MDKGRALAVARAKGKDKARAAAGGLALAGRAASWARLHPARAQVLVRALELGKGKALSATGTAPETGSPDLPLLSGRMGCS